MISSARKKPRFLLGQQLKQRLGKWREGEFTVEER